MAQPAIPSLRGPYAPWIRVALLLVALGSVFAVLAYREYESTLMREEGTLRTNARVVDENLSQQLLGASNALTTVRDDVPALVAAGQVSQISDRLTALTDAMPGVRTMLTLDASGMVIAASRKELVGRRLDHRNYFQRAKADPSRDTLYVSEPFQTALDVFSINLVKVWTGPRGEFAGVVAATLDPEYFEVLLRSVLYADRTRSTLLHGNGQIFMSLPAARAPSGLTPSTTGTLLSRHQRSGLSESFFQGPTGVAGEERMVAFRTTQPAALHMDRPLIVATSRAVAAVLAPWRGLVRTYALVYLLLAAMVLTSTWQEQGREQAITSLRAARLREERQHAERLDLALAGGDLGLWDLDLPTGIRTVNARAQQMVGNADDPVDDISRWEARVHPDDRAMFAKARQEHEAGNTDSLVSDYRVRHGNGQWVWIDSRGKVTERDAQGRALRITGTYKDITERKVDEERIRRSEELLARMSRVSRTGGWEFDLRTRRSTWSAEMYRIRELDPSVEPDQQVVMEAFDPESRKLLAAAREAAIAHHTPWDMELRMITAKGNAIWVRSQGEAVVENGRTVALTGTLKNVTWRKQSQIDLKIANEKLERMALSDGLTGIANRRLFDQTLLTEWQRSARTGQPLALLLIDIDHFKRYNDHYGHAAGDACLKKVAQLLASCSRRAGDLVSRFGGEEFAILLPAADSASACAVAQACIHLVRDARIPHAASPVGPFLSLSLGVASIQATVGRGAQCLIDEADAALYRAKNGGRDRYETMRPAQQLPD